MNQQRKFSLAAWVQTTTAAFTLMGVSPFHFPGGGNENTGFNLLGAMIGIFQGTVSGAIIGFLQQRIVLRNWLPRSRRWILAMMLSVGLIHGSFDGAPDSLGIGTVAFMSGVIMGVLQWVFFRRSISPLPWIVANIAIWTIVYPLGFPIADTLVAGIWQVRRGVLGAMLGFSLGTLTGILLHRNGQRKH